MIDIRVKIVLNRWGPKSKDHPRLFGLTTYPRRPRNIDARIWVNLRKHYRLKRRWHRGVDWMLEQVIRTVDHEMVHASLPEEEIREEKFARRFELAGSWARREP